jgi:pseudaminic acid synthase
MKIGNIEIGNNLPPFIIAEMSGNHNQSLDRALQIVSAAAEAGVQAIKLQTYTADTMTVPGAYKIHDENSLWNGKELYELYKEAYTPWEWHKTIFDKAKDMGILAFSSPFDESAVDFLESLDVPCYKIASFENTDWPLLKKVASTGKPIIMSTGVSNISDIYQSVSVLKNAGCQDLVLLKCTSTYPSSPKTSNITTIPHMKEFFKCDIGLSDHTLGIGVSVAAVALGASVIEKHFTLRRSDGGVDSAFSLEPQELRALVIESKNAFEGLGNISYDILPSEKNSMRFKRSIYVTRDIKSGEGVTKDNIRIIRPGYGLAPKHYEAILGRKALKDLSAGIPLTWNLIG